PFLSRPPARAHRGRVRPRGAVSPLAEARPRGRRARDQVARAGGHEGDRSPAGGGGWVTAQIGRNSTWSLSPARAASAMANPARVASGAKPARPRGTSRNCVSAINRRRVSSSPVTDPTTSLAPAPSWRRAARLATIASSLPYSNRAPSDEAAITPPAAANSRTKRAKAAGAFQS